MNLDIVIIVLQIFGSLAFFIFGMKMMSDGIQRAAGSQLRTILRRMTSNRTFGVFTGFLTTALVQSSSATTVMTVSFVNAGLLTLVESAGIMMGANVGTTITGWLISILGFEVTLGNFSIPLFAIGVPLLFAKNKKYSYWGEFVIGFAILFLGLSYLKDFVPNISNNPELFESLKSLTSGGVFSRIFFVLIGAIITIMVQSSSAAMAITLTLCFKGWIPLEVGASMILGENIGTTVTAEVASLVGNTNAKRSARIHSLFNIIGVTWMIIFMPWILNLVQSFVQNFTFLFEGHIPAANANSQDQRLVTFTLAAFHTVFNILNVLLLIGFVKVLVRLAIWSVPTPKAEGKEQKRLKFINSGMRTPELATVELQKETAHFGEIVARINRYAKTSLNAIEYVDREEANAQISKYEEISDNIEIEIAEYITNLANQEITPVTSLRLRSILNICNDLERIADIYYQISKLIEQKAEKRIYFTPDQRNNLNNYIDKISEAFDIMNTNLATPSYDKVDISRAQEMEKEINLLRDQYRDHNLTNIGTKGYDIRSAMIYNNIFSALEKIGDHIINVSQSISGEV